MNRRRSRSISGSAEFGRVYRNGSVFRGKLFALHIMRNALGETRLGLSVSKRVGNAVERNRVRRRLREVFRGRMKVLPHGLDVVISARPAAAQASFEELGLEFERVLGEFDVCAEALEVERGS